LIIAFFAGLSEALRIIAKHERYRRYTLNLIPSENIISPAVRKALASDLAGRYAFRPEFYGGTRYAHQVWEMAENLGCEVFRASYCSVAPLSGHVSLMIALGTCVKHGGKVASLPPETIGYPGLAQDKIPDALGFRQVSIPYDHSQHLVNVDEAVELIRREKPDAVVLGASIILFPHPVKELAEEAHSYGGRVIFDASHVLGLIPGRAYPNPLDEGADILLGSTHKSFFGPQGGIILTNDEKLSKTINENTLHKFVDNIHLNRVAALAVALEEMRRHADAYGSNVVGNAKALAYELQKQGIEVFKGRMGYTATHQVYWPKDLHEGLRVRELLEEAAIIADMGVRFGTNEITRRGFGAKQIRKVAELIRDALNGENIVVKREVKNLLTRFNKIKYTV